MIRSENPRGGVNNLPAFTSAINGANGDKAPTLQFDQATPTVRVMADANSRVILGIDLGTTNSLVAVCEEAGPRILPGDGNAPLLPSVVHISQGRDPVVGIKATQFGGESSAETVFSIKRFMGRAFADVGDDAARLPYRLVEGPRGLASVDAGGRVWTPQEISALILRSLKARAESVLKREVRGAVITVPAWFDDSQRQATRDAGAIAGLDVVRIINEPTAAALAYGIGQRQTEPETIAVYDLGGGTFDVSILRVVPASDATDSDPAFFEVLSTAGDTRLGGDDIDNLIAAWFCATAGIEPGVLTAEERHRLRLASESAKIRLSETETATIEMTVRGSVVSRAMSRSDFDQLILPIVDRTIASCRRALRDAQLSPEDIDRVVLVGGSTRIPRVREAVGEIFGRSPYTALDPEQVVALGASIQGAIIAGGLRSMLLLDVIPLSLGMETVGGGVAKLIMRNARIPARATEMFSTSVDGQTNVKIHVVQGEREMVKDCRSLGEFHLRGIPPMPAGIPQIEVEFLVDANGILTVEAVERRSARRMTTQVVPRYGLTRDDVDAMERESIAHARDDMRAHRLADLAVNAALDAKWIAEALSRVEPRLEPAYAAELRQRLDEIAAFVRQAKSDPASVKLDAFHHAKESLDRASMRLHEIAIAESLRGLSTPDASAPPADAR